MDNISKKEKCQIAGSGVCKVNKEEGKEAEGGIKHHDQSQGPGDQENRKITQENRDW